ncbi:hypothetical protein PR001_g25027 [Phytophthora rubi]|nr:hypothetical protein PR002_g25330 [Phytophthora rubi]KAE8977813.1 hypothetical protein PR001_g25027 [Phytophthora rubi]
MVQRWQQALIAAMSVSVAWTVLRMFGYRLVTAMTAESEAIVVPAGFRRSATTVVSAEETFWLQAACHTSILESQHVYCVLVPLVVNAPRRVGFLWRHPPL